jgi:photosystem II stability/assembly factor-like uncharacterized protein
MKYFLIFAVLFALLNCTVIELNAQWIRTNGPCGSSGIVNSIAIDSLNIFAVSNGSIFRSTDNGNTWSLVYSSNSTLFSISSIAMNSSFVYAGTNETTGGHGVFRSSDKGISWSPGITGYTPLLPNEILALSVSGSVVLASSAYDIGAAGMYRSTDNGNNWKRVSPSGITCYAFQGSNVFAAVGNQGPNKYGVYFSSDTGATWSAVNFPKIPVYTVAVKGINVFAGTDSSIYKSTDNGVTWNIAASHLSRVNSILFSPSGTYLYAGTNNGAFKSTNLGSLWTAMNTGMTTNDIYTLTVYPKVNADSSYIFAGTGGGIFRSSNNGETWMSTGLPNHQFTPSMSLLSSGPVLLSGAGYINNVNDPKTNYKMAIPYPATVVYASTDNGSTWNETDSGLSGMQAELTCFIKNGPNIYTGTFMGGVFLSTNNGAAWTNSSTGMNIHVYALAANGSDIYAGTSDGGVNLSTNNGLNWSTVNSGLTEISVSALAVSDSNIFAGTYYPSMKTLNYNSDVFLSTNKGTSWIKIDSLPTQNFPSFITCFSINGSNLLIGAGNRKINSQGSLTWSPNGGIYRMTFDGAKWNRSDSALTGQYITSLVSYGSNIFAGTYTSGVFASFNNGITWKSISDGLTDSSVVSLVVHNSNLFAATSSGVWRRQLSEITSVSSPNKTLPENYSLEQNYPNPFNPTTIISYTLSKASFVKLKVYDVLGREVQRLVNEYKNIGKYSVTFNGSSLSSGIYFYELHAGSFIQTKKLILLK